MAALPETTGATYPALRQIEHGEPQGGGPDGLWNEHGKVMIERTNHLAATMLKTSGNQVATGRKDLERLTVGGMIVVADETNARAQVNGFLRSGNIYLHSHTSDDALQPVQSGASSFLMRRVADGRLAYGTATGIVWTDADAARVRASSGYERFPSGFIQQWTTVTLGASATSVSGSFPISFPTACLHVWAFRETVSVPTANDMLTAQADSSSAFTLRSLSNAAARQFTVFAMGH